MPPKPRIRSPIDRIKYVKPFIFPLDPGTEQQPSDQIEVDGGPEHEPLETVISIALSIPLASRFRFLLDQTRLLVHQQGPYTLSSGTNHLTCSVPDVAPPQPTSQPFGLSRNDFVTSLGAIQAAAPKLHQQPPGPILEDLKVFIELWSTTTELLHAILDSNTLSVNTLGWGVAGLAAGVPNPDLLSLSHKGRLTKALKALSVLNVNRTPQGLANDAIPNPGPGGPWTQTSATRTAHTCAKLIIEDLKRDWSMCGWGFVVLVVERWVGHLGWEDCGGLVKRIKVAEHGASDDEGREAKHRSRGGQKLGAHRRSQSLLESVRNG